MQAILMVFQLVLGDFCERTRRYSYLVTLLGTLFFGYLVITGKWVLRLGEYQGVYNSAWVGSLMACASAIMLAIFGFYLVKNAISRDRDTGVGEILAATRLRNITYVISKFLSNLAVLTSMMVVLMVGAVAMQLLSNVEDGFDLWALVTPFLFICLPVLTLVAAMAVLFESVTWLRGTVGNILYFFIAEIAFVNSMLIDVPLLDFGGFGLLIPSMEKAALSAYPGADLGFEMGFVIDSMSSGGTKLFRWQGIDWSLGMVPLRLLWVVWALCLAGVATLNFDRFATSRPGGEKPSQRRRTPRKSSPVIEDPGNHLIAVCSWRDIAPVGFRFNFARMLMAELSLTLKGYHWAWYVVAAALFVVQLTVPYEYARAYALPGAMIWPLALWSGMGARETRFNTRQLMFSSAFPVSRQFPAVWLAGVSVAFLASGGMLLRAILAGEGDHAAALLIGILFVPTLALTLGTITGSRKLFEVSYLLIWYMGPVNGLLFLDFVGTTEVAAMGPIPSLYLVITLALAVVALLARWRQVAGGRS